MGGGGEAGISTPAPTTGADIDLPGHCSASGAAPGAGRSPLTASCHREGQHPARHPLGCVTPQFRSLLGPPCSPCEPFGPPNPSRLLAPGTGRLGCPPGWLTPRGRGCVGAAGDGVAAWGPTPRAGRGRGWLCGGTSPRDQSCTRLPATPRGPKQDPLPATAFSTFAGQFPGNALKKPSCRDSRKRASELYGSIVHHTNPASSIFEPNQQILKRCEFRS